MGRNLEAVRHDELVKQIMELEPALFYAFRIAATQDQLENRWELYSYLKRQCQDYVGYGARNSKLATNSHYEAFCNVLDALLPPADDVEWRPSAEEEEIYQCL